MKLAFLGNFGVPFSTESHHAWTWEKMGHQVYRLQENRATTDEVLKVCEQADAFQWTHSHGFQTPGPILLTEMLDRIHQMGLTSFSYHLDVYWGLDQWDKRETNIGKHPSWKTTHFFSTVGSKQAEFRSRGVNHHYLPAGVVEYATFEGKPQAHLATDILFAGSVNYHPEYPFRQKMVETLKAHYGYKFKIVQGVREEPLNNLYASAKVIVGDHCFAGEPLYASDRLYETVGRAGFIIYPRTEGVTDQIPGLVTYNPQDTNDLIQKIDWWLDPARDQERNERRLMAFEWVKKNATYTNRLQTILETIGLS